MKQNELNTENSWLGSVKLHPDKYPTDRQYPFCLPIFNETRELQFSSPVTFFAGANGTGKSTLLEAIAIAGGIHIWRTAEGTRYQVNPWEKKLYRYLSLKWTDGNVPGSYFGSEIFNDFRSILDSWAAADPGQLAFFGGKSLVTQSHGQSMMSYFRSRYKLKGIYFLDEPETALSPQYQLELLDILRENSKAGHAQFIIATHSPILLACENAVIYSFDHVPVSPIGYRQTDHYRIYKTFLSER